MHTLLLKDRTRQKYIKYKTTIYNIYNIYKGPKFHMTEQLVLLIILKMTLQMKGQTENISYMLVTIKTITVVLFSIKFCCFCVIPKI